MTADLIFLHNTKFYVHAQYQISQSGLNGQLLLAAFPKPIGDPRAVSQAHSGDSKSGPKP